MGSNGPTYYLQKYKTTQRPRPCRVCKQNAYYYHIDYDYLCAAHLLDLINIGGLLWDWTEYQEMWDRMGRLLNRSTTADATDQPLETSNAQNNNRLDG